MDDKFPPLNLPLRPETWAYRMPQAFLGLAPTFSTMPTPSAPSSDIWNHGSLAALLGLPSSGGILGQWTQLIGPPTSQTVWNSPTVRTPFLQPVSATTAQLNSNSYQSSVPAHSPKSLGANAGFASTPVESFDRPSTDQASNEIGGPSVQPPAPRVPLSGPDGWYYPEPAPPAPPEDFRTRLREALSDRNLRYYAGPGFSEFLDKLAGLIPLPLALAPSSQCRTARRPEKTLMPGATVARQPIWARASSIRDSIGCLRENNWRFWVE